MDEEAEEEEEEGLQAGLGDFGFGGVKQKEDEDAVGFVLCSMRACCLFMCLLCPRFNIVVTILRHRFNLCLFFFIFFGGCLHCDR